MLNAACLHRVLTNVQVLFRGVSIYWGSDLFFVASWKSITMFKERP